MIFYVYNSGVLMKKVLFYLIFLIETELLSVSVGILSTAAGIAIILAPAVAIGSIFIADFYMKEFFCNSELEQTVMWFALGVMELLAALLIIPHASMLAAFYVIGISSFTNFGFLFVVFCLLVVSFLVMIISLLKMWWYKKHEY